MHSSSDLELPTIDDEQAAALFDRTMAQSQRLRRRHRRYAFVAAAVTVAVVLGFVYVPSTTSPSVQSGSTVWHQLADVSAQFATHDVSFEGATLNCPTASTCYAVGNVGGNLKLEVTQDAGGQWSESTPPGHVNPTSISCIGAGTCAALATTASGGAFVETTDGGSSWSSSTFPAQSDGMATLSCTSTQDCVAVAESASGTAVALTTENSGQTWTSAALPIPSSSTSSLEVTGLSCFPNGGCTLLGSLHSLTTPSWTPLSLRSTDGGSTWAAGEVPASFVPGYDFSCSSSTTCLAVGNTTSSAPLVIATDDGGASWSEASIPAPTTPSGKVFINWISCTTTACWLSGGSFDDGSSHGFLDESTDHGASWTSTTLPPFVDALGNVSCTDGPTCFALGSESNGSGQGTFVLLSNAS